MGIISGMIERREKEIASGLGNAENWLIEAMGGQPTAAGVRVNPETALRATAVYACVRVISEDVAKLPLITYRRLKPRGKERAVDHPVYHLLHDRPNPWMTSFTFREAMQAYILLWGNACAEIEMLRNGRPVALWPLRPDMVRPVTLRKDGKSYLFYDVTDESGKTERLPAENVLHIPGLSFDGLWGKSMIAMEREAIGMYLAAQEYGARFFGNDARPGMILESPRALKEEEKERLKRDFEVKFQGLSKKFRVGVLERGWTLKEVGIPPKDAQFLELREFQVSEIARIFRMPPHKIGHMKQATYSNIEHQGIEYVVDCLQSHLVRWEQAINWKLFTEEERKTLFAEFLVDGLYRGDMLSRHQTYAIARQWGLMSANEIRELENKNPYEGGDDYWMPVNMIPANMASEVMAPTESRSIVVEKEIRSRRSANLRRRITASYRPAFRDAATRIIRREVNDIRRAAKSILGSRNLQQFRDWLEKFYREFPDAMDKAFTPIYMSYADAILAAAADELGVEPVMTPELEALIRDYSRARAHKHADSHAAQLYQIMARAQEEGLDPLDLVEERLGEWEERWPDKAAMRETVCFGGAFARAFFTNSGVMIVWLAGPNACPLCAQLNGQVVDRDNNFLRQGDTIEAEGVTPLTVKKSIGHPPLHDGCECMIGPG